MRVLIIFLIRHYLGLRLGEEFKFTNQKSDDNTYYFSNNKLMKVDRDLLTIKNNTSTPTHVPANVSLNWLLSDECDIEIMG